MVATVAIQVWHGTFGGTPSDITSTTIRFKRADNDAIDSANPLVITPTVTTYSFPKHTKLQIVTSPPNQIDNLYWFLDETSGGGASFTANGFRFYAGLNSTYQQGTLADVTALRPGIIDAEANYVTATPLTVVAGTLTLSTDGFPNYGNPSQDFVVQQMAATPTATAGVSPTKALVYRYDES